MEDDNVTNGFHAVYDPKTKLAIASTGIEDRHGEVIDQSGWDLKAYKKNPVLQWAHDHSEPAIGIAKNIKVEGEGKKARLVFEPIFHEMTDKARALKGMVEEGILKTFSVGFRPLDVDGNTYTRQELLEISLVNVPANADAQMLAYKTLKAKGFEDEVIKQVGINTQLIDKLIIMEKDIKDLQSAVKTQLPVEPLGKVLRNRQSMTKIIIRATDLMLAKSHKTNTQNQQLIKIIKRAGEKLSTSQKEQING